MRVDDLSWNLLRSFVAVARSGSLSGAARTLGASQPSLSRHMAELEALVGAPLFRRLPRGLDLTERGAELFEAALRVQEAVDGFARRAAGAGEAPEGTVRISASEVIAHHALPPILATLRRTHPRIALEVVADNRVANLLGRDADIAVRMFRPEQDDLVARKVGATDLGLYAHERYVAWAGVPGCLEEAAHHTLLGLDRDRQHLAAARAAGLPLGREDFAVRSDAQAFHVAAVLAGVGIGGLQVAVARGLPGLVRVLPEVSLGTLPVWLVAHDEVRRSARVRVVMHALFDGLSALYDTAPEAGGQAPGS